MLSLVAIENCALRGIYPSTFVII